VGLHRVLRMEGGALVRCYLHPCSGSGAGVGVGRKVATGGAPVCADEHLGAHGLAQATKPGL
jgi:hypothetical protein